MPPASSSVPVSQPQQASMAWMTPDTHLGSSEYRKVRCSESKRVAWVMDKNLVDAHARALQGFRDQLRAAGKGNIDESAILQAAVQTWYTIVPLGSDAAGNKRKRVEPGARLKVIVHVANPVIAKHPRFAQVEGIVPTSGLTPEAYAIMQQDASELLLTQL